MTEIQEWQLDAVDSVMRRCDALSDFSSDQFMETLEQMGFTIARRAPEPVKQKGMAVDLCTKITPHDPHRWSKDRGLNYRQCPGVARRRSLRAASPASQKDVRFCGAENAHGPHDWDAYRAHCPGKSTTQKRGPSFDLVIRDEMPQLSGMYTMTAEEPASQNPMFSFDTVPLESVWKTRDVNETECRVVEVYYRGQEAKEFYVRFEDEHGMHVRLMSGFVRDWERVQ